VIVAPTSKDCGKEQWNDEHDTMIPSISHVVSNRWLTSTIMQARLPLTVLGRIGSFMLLVTRP